MFDPFQPMLQLRKSCEMSLNHAIMQFFFRTRPSYPRGSKNLSEHKTYVLLLIALIPFMTKDVCFTRDSRQDQVAG